MKRKTIGLLLCLLLVLGGGSWWLNQQKAPPPVHYLTEKVKRGDLNKTVLASGSARAFKRIEVGAQVSGKIQKIYVSLGQAVKKGELIAEIESRNQQNNLDKAETQLAVYHAQLQAKQTALTLAQSQYQRISKLYQQKSSSQQEWENAQNSLAAAKAAVEEVQAQYKMAEIAVNSAKVDLAYTQIVSPIDGIVVSIPMTEGQTANANQSSPTIVQVADVSKMWVKMEIAEGDMSLVHQGQSVSLSTLSDPTRQYQGEIATIDPALTTLTDNDYSEKSGNTEAVYYYANVLLDNSDQHLRIGMTTQSKIKVADRKGVLLVPTTAIKQRQGKAIVQLLEQGNAVEKIVQVGLQDNQSTEIVSGLNENDEVIISTRAENEAVGNMPMRMRF